MGGSVTMPAPDPELEKAQIQDLRARMGIAKEQWAMAKEMQPKQKEQLQFGLDASKTAYEQTQADRAYALKKRDSYDLALEGFLNEADKFNEVARSNELGQQVAADVSSTFSAAQGQQRRGLTRFNPLSGKVLMAEQQGELAEAKAKADANRVVRAIAKEEGLDLKKQSVQALSSFPDMAAQLSPTSATLGWSGVNTMNEGMQGINAGYSMGAGLSGAVGANAGNLYNMQSKMYSQSLADNAERKGELMGTIAGVGGTMAKGKGGEWLARANEAYNPNFMGPARPFFG